MPIRLRSRAKPTHHRRPARGGGGTIPTEDNSPVAFSTSPNIVIILFRLPSSLLSSRRFFNRYPGILIAPAFRFTTQPLLPTCCESVAFGYKRRRRRRDTDSIARIRKREADFLDRDSKRFSEHPKSPVEFLQSGKFRGEKRANPREDVQSA